MTITDAEAAGILYANRWRLYMTEATMITDEMVEKVRQMLDYLHYPASKDDVRAALEAVEPMIRAEVLWDLAAECYQFSSDGPRLITEKEILKRALLPRAEELDPK